MAFRIASKLKFNKNIAQCRCLFHVRSRFLPESISVKAGSKYLGLSQLDKLESGCENVHWCSINNLKKERKLIHTSSRCLGKVLPFNLSDIGEGIAEVTVIEWFVEEGSVVSQFDNICEVQSDKASVTITSKFDGVVKTLHYAVDDIARVGTALVDIEVSHGEEAEVDEDGEHLLEDEPITPPLPEVDRVPPRPASSQDTVKEKIMKNTTTDTRGVKALATPAVRRLAAEYNINLDAIIGTGRDGRVLKEDILQHLDKPSTPSKAPQVAQAAAQTVTPATMPMPSSIPTVASAQDRVEAITGIGKVMVKAMTDALSIPHFGYCDEINADALFRVRKQLKKECESYGIKMSYMPFFIKATSMALLEYPVINSAFNPDAMTLTYKGSHNIGVAMDTSVGLIVPNVKDVQNKTLLEIAVELNRLHQLGLSGKLAPADLTNGTISLSNIGSIGGTYTKPLIVPPAVAIAAIGQTQRLPRFDKNGDVYPANIFNISWSADHRVIDGATMARFSNQWKAYIESPEKMLLHLK